MLCQNNQTTLNQQSENNNSIQKVKFSLKMKNNSQIECYISIWHEDDSQLLPMILDFQTQIQDEIIYTVVLPLKELVVYNYLYQIKKEDVILRENFPRQFQYSNQCLNQIDEWNKYYYRYAVSDSLLCLVDLFEIQVVRENNSTLVLQKCQNLTYCFEGFELIENNNEPVSRCFLFQYKSNPSLKFQSKPTQLKNQSIQMNSILIQFNMNLMESQATKMKALIDESLIKIEKQEQQKNNAKQKELDLLDIEEKELSQNLQLQRNKNYNLEQQIQKATKLHIENKKLENQKLKQLRYETEQFKQNFEIQKQQFLISLQQDCLTSQKSSENNILIIQEELQIKKQQNEQDFNNLQQYCIQQLNLHKQSLLAETNQLDELMQNSVQNQIQSAKVHSIQIDQSEEIPQNVNHLLSQLQYKIEELEGSLLDDQSIIQNKEKSYKSRAKKIYKKKEQLEECQKSCMVLEDAIANLELEVQHNNDKVNKESQIIRKLKEQIKQTMHELQQYKQELAESMKQIEASNQKKESLKNDLEKMDKDFQEKQEKQISHLQSLHKKAEVEIQKVELESRKNKEKLCTELKTLKEQQLLYNEQEFNSFQRQLEKNSINEFFLARKNFFDKVRNYQSEVKVLVLQILDDIEKNQIQFFELEKSQEQQNVYLFRFEQLFNAIKENQDVFLIDVLLQFIFDKKKKLNKDDIRKDLLEKINVGLDQLKKLINSQVKESKEVYSSDQYQAQFQTLINTECQQYYQMYLESDCKVLN